MHFAEVPDSKSPQWRGVCPFCQKAGHFFFGAEYGWGCKACQLEGNIYTFLKHIYNDVCTHDLVGVLAMERSIDFGTFTRNGVKYNPKNASFVIPTFNSQGNLNYLYKVIQVFDEKRQKNVRRILNTPGIEPTLFSWPHTAHDTIWLCEGLWDKMAAEDIIGPARPITVVAFPGSVFKPTWCHVFANKHLIIIADNDEAGAKHIEKIIHKISQAPQKPSKISVLHWPNSLPKGYDVNDLLIQKGVDAYSFIESNLIETEDITSVSPKIEIIPDTTCTSFDHLTDACSLIYHFTGDMRMLLHLLITGLYSLKIEGEQIWIRVMGPPGSSKTTIAKIAGASDGSIMRSTFTGLLSGWKDDDPKDASLISMLSGKFLIVKDGDALLQLPNVKQILSQLRDFYDKFISATYLNRVSYEYENIRSGFCFCGTHALRHMDNTALGERFLDFELRVSNDDKKAITNKSLHTAIAEATTGISAEPAIAAKAKNFIDNIVLNYEGVANLHTDDHNAIETFGNVIAYLRAKVERNRSGEISYKPLPEVPSRIIKQLVKIYTCAPVVLGKTEPGTETYDLARKITLDICDTTSYRYKLAHFLSVCPKQSLFQLVEATEIHPKIVEREMENMRALDMLHIDKIWTGPGNALRVASLKPDIESQLRELNRTQ